VVVDAVPHILGLQARPDGLDEALEGGGHGVAHERYLIRVVRVD
jgi:hypothetical protein